MERDAFGRYAGSRMCMNIVGHGWSTMARLGKEGFPAMFSFTHSAAYGVGMSNCNIHRSITPNRAPA